MRIRETQGDCSVRCKDGAMSCDVDMFSFIEYLYKFDLRILYFKALTDLNFFNEHEKEIFILNSHQQDFLLSRNANSCQV